MDIDLNRLRVFLHVHRARSVSDAAAELHVTQSAVSQSLAKLEDELGVPLFIRRHRRLVPTPAAAILQGVVAPFVDALHEGLAEIHRTHHELSGTLRVGAPVEFGTHRLAEAMAAFRARHPGVSFELTLGHPSELLPRIDDGHLDIAFTDVFESAPPPSRPGGLEIVEVMEERLVLVASARYEAEHLGRGRGRRRLSAASFIAYRPRAPAIQGWFRHHFDRAPARLDIALTVESVQAVAAAVRASMGLGLLPLHTVEAELRTGALVAIATRRRPITNRISLARVLDKIPSRAERAFVRFLVERPPEPHPPARPKT